MIAVPLDFRPLVEKATAAIAALMVEPACTVMAEDARVNVEERHLNRPCVILARAIRKNSIGRLLMGVTRETDAAQAV